MNGGIFFGSFLEFPFKTRLYKKGSKTEKGVEQGRNRAGERKEDKTETSREKKEKKEKEKQAN